MVEQDPEARRRRRLALPAVGFVGGILVLAVIIATVILVVYLVGGGERAD